MITVVVAVVILLIGCMKKVDLYAAFAEGAQRGLKTAVLLLPNLCAALLITASLRGSGVMELLSSLLQPLLARIGLDGALIPFLVMRPVSGSASLSALRELMAQYGADSRPALLAAAMMGSSETVLYVLSVYLGSVKMRSGRYVLWAALLSMAAGMCVTVWAVDHLL